jgi:hypothetical protein
VYASSERGLGDLCGFVIRLCVCVCVVPEWVHICDGAKRKTTLIQRATWRGYLKNQGGPV